MNFDNIPLELKQYPHWCLWKYISRPGETKPSKIPYHPLTGQKAKSNDPSTFAPFDVAMQAFSEKMGYDGIGVGLFGNSAAADIDNCIDSATNQPNELARDVISTMSTYTEISPSGKGLRLFFLVPGFRFDKGRYFIKKNLEIYIAGITNRFVTVTGNVYGFPLPIADCSAALLIVLERYMLRPTPKETAPSVTPPGSMLSDDQVIAKAAAAKNSAIFKRLWQGDTSGYPSHSEADQALCNMLAFGCGGDIDQMDRLFRDSGLYRNKWEREDYRNSTLENAVRGCKAFYGQGSAAVTDFAGIVPAPDINPLSDRKRYTFNDKGNGYLFADLYNKTIRHCPQAKGWYVYRKGKWEPDIGDTIAREYAKGMSDYLFRHISETTDNEREAYKKNAGLLYSLAARERMLRDAQSVNPIRLEDLDANTDLLNVLNGTLNLTTGIFAPHSAADMISKKAGAAFMPDADCPLWKWTLDGIFKGKADVIRYLQKVYGYALLGKPVEKQFFIQYGPDTDNGKSTVTQTVEYVMGDYALNAPPELIAEKRFKDSSKPSGDRARLAGVRLVTINEPERGMRLDEAYVKAVTGRDTQTARHLHQSEFQYAVQFIMVISTNHLPYVNDQTLFKSQRVRVIPFERRFEEHEKNKHLIDLLRQPQEASDILNWLLEGLAAYRREGLQPPPIVAAIVDGYRLKSDNVARFMEEWTEPDINGAVQTTALHMAFSAWCTAEGISTMSVKSFVQALKERGFNSEQMRFNGSSPVMHIQGIKCTFSNT